MGTFKAIEQRISELAAEGEIGIHGSYQALAMPNYNTIILGGNHRIEFITYATKPMFKAEDLNNLLLKIIPEELRSISPSGVRPFTNSSNSLEFGYYKYYENIGTVRFNVVQTIDLNDVDNLLNSNDLINKTHNPQYYIVERCIFVSLLPSKEVAESLYPNTNSIEGDISILIRKGLSRFSMQGKYYQEYLKQFPETHKPSVFEKIKNLFK